MIKSQIPGRSFPDIQSSRVALFIIENAASTLVFAPEIELLTTSKSRSSPYTGRPCAKMRGFRTAKDPSQIRSAQAA